MVTAVEGNRKRSQRLVENLKRLGLEDKCRIVVKRGEDWVPPGKGNGGNEEESVVETRVSGILLDVPCSSTGTGRRKPDVLTKDGKMKHLLKIQQTLASHCADTILDVGGVMVYATCSSLRAESEDQVHKL